MKEAGVKAWLPSLLRLVLVVLLVAFVTNPGWFEPLLK
ncbi:MAG: ABC transporter permease, partial [Mesorhizobium sp.]